MHTSLEEKPPGPLSWSEGSPLPTCRVRCRGAGASAGGGRALSISCCMRIWCTCALCISIISTMSEGRAPGGGRGSLRQLRTQRSWDKAPGEQTRCVPSRQSLRVCRFPVEPSRSWSPWLHWATWWPNSVHVLTPRTSEHGLTWKKGPCGCDKDLEVRSPK